MKKFKLSQSQYRALSNITADFSAVSLGSMVIPVLLGDLDSFQQNLLLLGLSTTFALIVLSLYFARKGKL